MAAGLLTTLAPATAFADVPSSGTVLFEDDFTGSANAAPSSSWYDYSTCTYDSTAAFGAIDCGVDETLDGSGHLVIPADATHGSALRSHFTFQYGTMTARMKMPATEGYWPAFWALNNDPEGGAATEESPVGEVDAVEAYTKWGNVYHAAGHSYDGTNTYNSADNRCPASEDTDLTQWHDYGAKIEPGKVTYYFDGVQCGDAYEKDTEQPWGLGPDVERGNWLILQNAVGGAGGQQATPSQADNVLVDRVEVRALDVASDAVDTGSTYKIVNTCGGKVLEVPGGSTSVAEALKTGTWSGTDYQKWELSLYPSSTYWKLKNVNSGQTANVIYASNDNGAAIIQYTDNGGSNAEWTITPGINGNYQVTAHNSGKNLDVYANSASAGATVDQYAANTSCGQTWQLVKL